MMSLVLCTCHARCIFADPLQMSHACQRFCSKPSRFAHFWQGAESMAPHAMMSERLKVVRTCGVCRHFDFEICLTPQPHALYQHPNFQKWSETASFPHFQLITSKCAFCRSDTQVFNIATSKNVWKVMFTLFYIFWLRKVLGATTARTF